MKQVICECGRIAEVRRRSNGKKLRYKHCKCGTALGGTESALNLEREEKDDIGEFGAFFEKAESVGPVVVPVGDADKQTDWVPDLETMPEEMAEVKAEEKKPNGILKAVGFGLVVVAAVCGGGFCLSNLQRFKG